MIAALFVESNGVYFDLPGIDSWDLDRNALLYKGPHKVIAHPPCKRWGRYWGGGPSVKVKRLMGNDDNCFAHSLWSVRTFGGIIEHPEASHAYKWFGLKRPSMKGGWTIADDYGGLTCCVEQGHYGHKARKATWLYINKIKPVELKWGYSGPKDKIEESFKTKEIRDAAMQADGYTPAKRLSSQERLDTPIEFRNLLIGMINN